MALPLRVLILEDRQSDAQLMISELRQADFAPIWERVDAEADFLKHLSPTVEVILCDYTLPQFDAIHALRLVQQQQLDIPFIVVAGTIEDDVAVQAIHMGAADYILKDRMARLGPAVRRALEQQRLRRETARIEEALIKSESRLRGMIEKNADGILIVDQQGTIHFLNPAAETLLGRSQGEILGTLWGFPMVSGQTIEVDIVHQHEGPKSAEMRVVEIDWEGTPAYLASLRDITDRKQAQLTLLERARLAALTAAVGLALNTSDTLQDMLHHCAESIVRHLDAAFVGFWTLHPDESFLELQGSAGQSADTHGPLSRVPVGQFMIGLVAQERQPYLTNDLDVSPYVSNRAWARRENITAFAGYPLLIEDRLVGVMALFTRQQYTQATRDTLGTVANQIALGIERKQGEEALRALQQRLQQVITASPAVIYSMHVEDNSLQSLTWVSGNLQRLLGYTSAQALAPDWWYEHVHPEDRAQVLTNLPELFVHGMLLQEYRVRHRDGSYRWVRDERRLQFHTAGQPREIVGSWSDMTVWKHLQEQFHHAQRMEAIGRLAGGVAHDFNNLLTVINGYSGMALGNALLDTRMRRQLEEIKKAGERAATLTRQLLAFSRKQMLQPTVVDFNGLLAEMEKMLRHVIGEDIDFTVHYKPDVWRVKADAGQLEQVIMNLVVNARDAMPDGGKLTIETANVTLQENFMTTRREPRVGQYVMVAVSDTGCGIDESIEGRLFEPFFTTKEPGKGTGLGLATVYGIIKQSNGHIGVYSEPGFGTTFKLYLPRYAGETLAEAADPSPVVTRHGTETVLLVEDDDSVRVLAHTILMESGYKVLEARNGLEALLMSEQYGAPIHLLVTDVVMPKISGRQLAERLLLLHPGLKVLYLSGYTDDAVVRHGVVEANVPFLQKPFPPRLLVQKVREVLDG